MNPNAPGLRVMADISDGVKPESTRSKAQSDPVVPSPAPGQSASIRERTRKRRVGSGQHFDRTGSESGDSCEDDNGHDYGHRQQATRRRYSSPGLERNVVHRIALFAGTVVSMLLAASRQAISFSEMCLFAPAREVI